MGQGQPLKYGMEKPRAASPSHRCQDLKCAGPWDKASSACLTIPPPTAGRYTILSSYLPPFIADLGSTWAQPLGRSIGPVRLHLGHVQDQQATAFPTDAGSLGFPGYSINYI